MYFGVTIQPTAVAPVDSLFPSAMLHPASAPAGRQHDRVGFLSQDAWVASMAETRQHSPPGPVPPPQGPDPRGLRPGQLCLQPRSLSPLLRTTPGTWGRVQEAVPFLAAFLLMMSLPLSELSRKKNWKNDTLLFPTLFFGLHSLSGE